MPRRAAAAAAIAAGLLWNFAQSGYDGGPEVGRSTAAEIATFYADGAFVPRLGAVLGGLVFVLFLAFLSGLRSRFRESGVPEELTAFSFAAGIAVGVLFLLALAAVTAPLVRPLDGYDDSFVTGMQTLRAFGEQLVFGMVPRAALIGGVALAALRHGALPRWLGVVSLIIAVVAAAGTLRFLFSPTAALFGVFDGLSILTNFTVPVWLVLCGIALLRPARSVHPATA